MLVLITFLIIFVLSVPVASKDNDELGRVSDTYVEAINSPVIQKYWKMLSDNPLIRQRQEFAISQCERFGADPMLGLAIISCEGGLDNPSKCNYEYGCSGGQGPWQIIPKTWDNTIIEMAKLGLLEPECINTESVFIMECNLTVGAYILATKGTDPWGTADTAWGSNHCWSK